MSAGRWVAIGAFWGALGVAFGAMGAHALEERLIESGHLDAWRTAASYHLWHALALVLYGVACSGWKRRPGWVAWALATGSLAFSGSIYGLALGGPGAILGPITPLGGLLMIAGWVGFGVSGLRTKLQPDENVHEGPTAL